MERKLLVIVSLLFFVNLTFGQYIDMGLPSGTKWKSQSETNSYTYAYAIRYFDGFLPTSGQFQELIDNCTWKWTGKGYKVIGRNGNIIYLSAKTEGKDVDIMGAFWSTTKFTTEYGAECCYGLLFWDEGVKVDKTCNVDTERNVILCIMK